MPLLINRRREHYQRDVLYKPPEPHQGGLEVAEE
jgi:hypothetical protein